MCKKIDDRLPRNAGEGVLPMHASVKTPWEKLISYHDAAHYCQRYGAVISAAMLEAFRILMPDYVERSKLICDNAYKRLYGTFGIKWLVDMQMDGLCIHPFMSGQFTGGCTGDVGDEAMRMCGRVRDFGTYRVEKELDVCYWDIVGSEVCRSTTQSLQGCADRFAEQRHPGPKMEYHMVEAKGCGDLHCRIVAESREKYPMPPHEQWECFGPVATADQIKFTEEKDCVYESCNFRGEAGYEYISGTCAERDVNSAYPNVRQTNAYSYILPALEQAVKMGRLDADTVTYTLERVCHAAGKAAFGEAFAKEGLRAWLGAPHNVDDGRLLGGYIEVLLGCMQIPYEVEAFNKEEVILRIDRAALANREVRLVESFVAYWAGMARTLINAQWFLWEEAGDTDAKTLRIKIAKKIDKFA